MWGLIGACGQAHFLKNEREVNGDKANVEGLMPKAKVVLENNKCANPEELKEELKLDEKFIKS